MSNDTQSVDERGSEMGDDSQEIVDEISKTATETSNNCQQLVDEMDEWVVDIEGRHATRRPSMDSNSINSSISGEFPSIFGNWQCWDDFGTSFIPENQKWHLVAFMMTWFGLNVRSYLEYMQEKADLAWSYYHVVDEQFRDENSKCFIEHLLVKSCFLLFAMISMPNLPEEQQNVIDDKLDIPKGLTLNDFGNFLTFISGDLMRNQCYMLTMKNQTPWFVVEAVYTKHSTLSSEFLNMPIHKLALSYIDDMFPTVHPSKEYGGNVPEGGFKHLLHIFHWSRSPDGKYPHNIPTHKFSGDFHIPSATELQLSQIVFVNNVDDNIDVSYSDNRRLWRLTGVIQLTPWYFWQYTTELYRGLLIFEQQYRFIREIPFTAYVTCMSCFLKTEADVKLLRDNGIIPIPRFEDKDVLLCVEELKSLIPENIFPPPELMILEEKVMAHYQRSAYRVYGEFKSRYCSNPWITISVIAAILLFVLTIIQTIYSVLSYNKQ